jgi:TetR/AcrR family transcriptional regulator, mexJK operon transcriptional repressor
MATEPLEQGAFKRGRGGRPTQEEAERRHRSLLATATRLFLEKGWDGVSIDEISRSSGVAKRFIYARYPDKAALFVGAIMRFRANLVGEIPVPGSLPDDVDEGLVAFGRWLLDLALRPEALAMHRLFIAEAIRFPQLAKLFVERFRGRGVDEIVAVLSSYAERGALRLDDPQFMAEQFFINIIGLPQRMALLAGRDPPAEEERRLRAAVRLFLDGCRASAPTEGARPRPGATRAS